MRYIDELSVNDNWNDGWRILDVMDEALTRFRRAQAAAEECGYEELAMDLTDVEDMMTDVMDALDAACAAMDEGGPEGDDEEDEEEEAGAP
ncbi:MAG: hypothetical protein ACLFQQ_22915 [Desulfococcaceae bacterium]